MDLGQPKNNPDFKLIKAEGIIDETVACFQMMSNYLELPFRKDVIEKVLKDALRRGQTPNIQICGQIGASLGLHVAASRVPSSMGTRIQIPSFIN